MLYSEPGESRVRVQLPGGSGQVLLVAVGVHGEAAVAAAPVVAVGGKAARDTTREKLQELSKC